MSEQEQLYGIWYNIANRWARLTPPYELCKKYGHSAHSNDPLFVNHQDMQDWYDDRCAYDPLFTHEFSIRPIDTLNYANYLQRVKLHQERLFKEEDQRRRKIHADKYL